VELLRSEIAGGYTVLHAIGLLIALAFFYFAVRTVGAMFVPKPADNLRQKMQCGVCGWTGIVSKHKSRCAQCGGTTLTTVR
jgi:hypothetical protein